MGYSLWSCSLTQLMYETTTSTSELLFLYKKFPLLPLLLWDSCVHVPFPSEEGPPLDRAPSCSLIGHIPDVIHYFPAFSFWFVNEGLLICPLPPPSDWESMRM